MRKPPRSARYIAIEILSRWEERKLPLDLVIERCLAETVLNDPRDLRFIKSLVYGVMRQRGYLDWIMEKFSQHPLAGIKNRTMQALRAGLFQLLFMDRVPASAAINETVQALKDMRQPKWLTGFVNGLLRNVERGKLDIPHPLQPQNADLLPEAALLSHPAWLINRWKTRYGAAEAARICLRNNTQPPLWLRVNSRRTTSGALLNMLRDNGLHAEAGKYSPLAVKLVDYQGPVTAVPGFADGLFQVQDEAAQLVSLLLGPLQPGESYLDGCAGLGGKTSHLAQMLPPQSSLTAVEPNRGRLDRLQENLVRLRLDGTVTIIEGSLAALPPASREKFAGVLIDAPCSGLGVIRRHPDIRWSRNPDDLRDYQEKQGKILKDGARLVAAQGILVYATCSTEPEENDAAVHAFLAAHPDFVLSDCREVLPESCAPLVDNLGFFRTLPGRDDLDGFFAARMTKK